MMHDGWEVDQAVNQGGHGGGAWSIRDEVNSRYKISGQFAIKLGQFEICCGSI